MTDDCDGYPAWLAPGSQVAIVTGAGSVQRVIDTTVERVGKRDIVLANGERFSLTRLRCNKVYRHSKHSYAPSDVLVSRDNDLVRQARQSQERARLVGAARAAAAAIEAALRRNELPMAREPYITLTDHLHRLGVDVRAAEVAR